LASVNKTTKSFENKLSWKLIISKILAKAPGIKLKIVWNIIISYIERIL